MSLPARATARHPLAGGVVALWPGVALLPQSRALLVADAHLAYEDVIGGALPLWSTDEAVATIALTCRRTGARELIFLGDVVHGAQMSEGAARRVRAALDALRAECRVTLIAGNHEGRSRAFALLGASVERLERDGWLLVHGDGAPELGRRTIIGHVHPSLRLGGGATAPAFVGSEKLVVFGRLSRRARRVERDAGGSAGGRGGRRTRPSLRRTLDVARSAAGAARERSRGPRPARQAARARPLIALGPGGPRRV
jgi:metallophosphoesterase superfamily enzyme